MSREPAYQRRLRATIETWLASAALRAVRVDLRRSVFAGVSDPDLRRQRLAKLSPAELAAITFEFDLKTKTAARVNKRMADIWRRWRAHEQRISPHYRLLSELAQIFLPTSVVKADRDALEALTSYYRMRGNESGFEVPALDLATMHVPHGLESETESSRTTLQLPSSPPQLIASAFRWARMTVEHARPELGDAETAKALGALDRLVRRLLRKSIAGRPTALVRDLLGDMRRVLGRAGHDLPSLDELSRGPVAEPTPIFSAPDLDALTAAFSGAANLKWLSAAAVKKDQQRRGLRRARQYSANKIGTSATKKHGRPSRSRAPD